MKGLIGKKLGMTSIYDENGLSVPVTVLEAGPCTIIQHKEKDTDGYSSVQLGYEAQKEHRLNKSAKGHFKKAGVDGYKVLREFRVKSEDEIKVGETINTNIFEEIKYVDIISTGKGRGFQGVVKRYDFGGGRASHGGGWLRRPGSIGMCTSPGRVFKGRKMPGHMGGKRVTTQNLKIVEIRSEDHLILVKGSVPGANGSILIIQEALKK